ncbi:hypothetical protein ACJX0J_027513, partial [Zea mays]
SFIHRMNKLSHKTDSYMQGFKEHCKNPTIVLLHKVVNHGTKNFRNYKRKLSFGAKVLQAGGIDKVFREYFAVEKDEKLRKAFQCYLSTTAGPIAGMLFISTKKIAFHSDRPLSFTSPKGGSTRVPYKVLIPTERMKSASVRILYFLSVSFFVGTELCCRTCTTVSWTFRNFYEKVTTKSSFKDPTQEKALMFSQHLVNYLLCVMYNKKSKDSKYYLG